MTTGGTAFVEDEVDGYRVARAGLLRCAEPPSALLSVFVAHVGPVGAWDRIRRRAAPAAVAKAVAPRIADLDAEVLQRRAIGDLEWAADLGARLVVPEDPEWPVPTMAAFGGQRGDGEVLMEPLALYVRGKPLPPSHLGSVTVVGSRACTPYGSRVAAELAGGLVDAGRRVVSGAAFGIDGAAHRGALGAGGPFPTVAVLACGADRVYPQAHRELVERIAEVGVVVTEYPPGTTPARHRFLVRNRIIAALGEATVVVEAGRRSGSTATSNAAQRLGRVVAAVPGPVTSAMSAGCHTLITDHEAVLVTSARDVLALLCGGPLVTPEPVTRPTDGLSADGARVFEALPGRGGRSTELIAEEAGLFVQDAIGELAELELRGLAHRDGLRWRRHGG